MLIDTLRQHYTTDLAALDAAGYRADVLDISGGFYAISADLGGDRYFLAINHGDTLAGPGQTRYPWEVEIYDRAIGTMAVTHWRDYKIVDAVRAAERVRYQHVDTHGVRLSFADMGDGAASVFLHEGFDGQDADMTVENAVSMIAALTAWVAEHTDHA